MDESEFDYLLRTISEVSQSSYRSLSCAVHAWSYAAIVNKIFIIIFNKLNVTNQLIRIYNNYYNSAGKVRIVQFLSFIVTFKYNYRYNYYTDHECKSGSCSVPQVLSGIDFLRVYSYIWESQVFVRRCNYTSSAAVRVV